MVQWEPTADRMTRVTMNGPDSRSTRHNIQQIRRFTSSSWWWLEFGIGADYQGRKAGKVSAYKPDAGREEDMTQCSVFSGKFGWKPMQLWCGIKRVNP